MHVNLFDVGIVSIMEMFFEGCAYFSNEGGKVFRVADGGCPGVWYRGVFRYDT